MACLAKPCLSAACLSLCLVCHTLPRGSLLFFLIEAW